MVDQGSHENLPWATIEMKNAINSGQMLGPRMQVAGPVLNPPGAAGLQTSRQSATRIVGFLATGWASTVLGRHGAPCARSSYTAPIG